MGVVRPPSPHMCAHDETLATILTAKRFLLNFTCSRKNKLRREQGRVGERDGGRERHTYTYLHVCTPCYIHWGCNHRTIAYPSLSIYIYKSYLHALTTVSSIKMHAQIDMRWKHGPRRQHLLTHRCGSRHIKLCVSGNLEFKHDLQK